MFFTLYIFTKIIDKYIKRTLYLMINYSSNLPMLKKIYTYKTYILNKSSITRDQFGHQTSPEILLDRTRTIFQSTIFRTISRRPRFVSNRSIRNTNALREKMENSSSKLKTVSNSTYTHIKRISTKTSTIKRFVITF